MDKTLYKQKRTVLSCFCKLLGFVLIIQLSGCRNEEQEKRILFTGDILLSRNVRLEIENRNSEPWSDLKELFMASDLVVGNLEGAVGENNEVENTENSSLIFNIKEQHIPLLSKAAFTTITCENNHSYDLGEKGKLATLATLKKNNLKAVHYDNSPYFIKVDKYTIAIVALNMVKGRDGKCNEIPSTEVKQKLRLAKSLSNLVIISIHWGNELLEWPNPSQRNTAKWLVHHGADLIIGSHPHVVQKPEMIDGKPVFFSLGNHLFDQKYLSTKKGLIADCRIKDKKLTCSGIVTHTKKNSFFPEIVSKADYDLGSISLKENFFIGDLTVMPVSETESGKIILEVYKEGKKLWQTHPMSIVSISKARLEGNKECLITLEKHYSSLDKEINLRPYVYFLDERGLTAKWRGSSLAWPLLDAVISSSNDPILCALHRGDSFIALNKTNQNTRIAAYKWNGFGFAGVEDEIVCTNCEEVLNSK
jgi:hypothetical protein